MDSLQSPCPSLPFVHCAQLLEFTTLRAASQNRPREGLPGPSASVPHSGRRTEIQGELSLKELSGSRVKWLLPASATHCGIRGRGGGQREEEAGIFK